MNMLFNRKLKKVLLRQASQSPDYWDGIAEKLNIKENDSKNSHSKRHYSISAVRYAVSCVLAVSIICFAAFGSTIYDNLAVQNKSAPHLKNNIVSKALHRLDFIVCASELPKSNSAAVIENASSSAANSNPNETTNFTNLKENKLTSLGTQIQNSKLSSRFIVSCDGEIDTLSLKSDKGVFYKGRTPRTPEEVKAAKSNEEFIKKAANDPNIPGMPKDSIEAKYAFNVGNYIFTDSNSKTKIITVENNMIVEPGNNTLIKEIHESKDTSFWWETTPDILTYTRNITTGNAKYNLAGPINITATVKFKDGQELTKTLVLDLNQYGVLEATVK